MTIAELRWEDNTMTQLKPTLQEWKAKIAEARIKLALARYKATLWGLGLEVKNDTE